MTKPTKPGWYWVKRTYGADEWMPASVGTRGGVCVFWDTEHGDGSDVREWGPRIVDPDGVCQRCGCSCRDQAYDDICNACDLERRQEAEPDSNATSASEAYRRAWEAKRSPR